MPPCRPVPPDTWLAINVNPTDWCCTSDVGAAYLLDLLGQMGVNPGRIVIEITETACELNDSRFLECIRAFRQQGCRIAIDDMGVGSGDLGRLAVIRPEIVKVDRSLVTDATADFGYRAIVEALAMAAQTLGAALLLEGVEAEDQMGLALRLGAQYVQGFLFAPALPDLADAEHLVDRVCPHVDRFRARYLARLQRQYDVRDAVQATLRAGIACLPRPSSNTAEATDAWSEFAASLLTALPPMCYRLYVCAGESGNLSGVVERTVQGRAAVLRPLPGCNWNVRSHFLRNVTAAVRSRHAILSPVYEDRVTHRPTRTLTCALNHDAYVFVDLDMAQVDEEFPEWPTGTDYPPFCAAMRRRRRLASTSNKDPGKCAYAAHSPFP